MTPADEGPSRVGVWSRGLVGVAVVAGALEALGRAGLVAREDLPPTSVFVARAVRLVGDGTFVTGVVATLKAAAIGLLLAAVVAVPLGLLLGSVPRLRTALRAVVEFLRPIPPVALIPLATLLLGMGAKMEIVLVCYAALWPLLFNTIYGVQDADPAAKDSLRAFGFRERQVLWLVSLPSAAPFIATGLRIAAGFALIVSIGVEILTAWSDGLGTFIANAGNLPGGMEDVLAGTVWAGVIGLLINFGLVRAERRLFRWHGARTDGVV